MRRLISVNWKQGASAVERDSVAVAGGRPPLSPAPLRPLPLGKRTSGCLSV